MGGDRVYFCIRWRRLWAVFCAVLAVTACGVTVVLATGQKTEKQVIKWVEFTPTYGAMAKALELDIASHREEAEVPLDWVELLACLGVKYGGDFSRYRESHLTKIAQRLQAGESVRR